MTICEPTYNKNFEKITTNNTIYKMLAEIYQKFAIKFVI